MPIHFISFIRFQKLYAQHNVHIYIYSLIYFNTTAEVNHGHKQALIYEETPMLHTANIQHIKSYKAEKKNLNMKCFRCCTLVMWHAVVSSDMKYLLKWLYLILFATEQTYP